MNNAGDNIAIEHNDKVGVCSPFLFKVNNLTKEKSKTPGCYNIVKLIDFPELLLTDVNTYMGVRDMSNNRTRRGAARGDFRTFMQFDRNRSVDFRQALQELLLLKGLIKYRAIFLSNDPRTPTRNVPSSNGIDETIVRIDNILVSVIAVSDSIPTRGLVPFDLQLFSKLRGKLGC